MVSHVGCHIKRHFKYNVGVLSTLGEYSYNAMTEKPAVAPHSYGLS